jgi:hypothetical protein
MILSPPPPPLRINFSQKKRQTIKKKPDGSSGLS